MSAPANYRHGGREGRPTRKDDWRTPPELYARLNAEFHFAVDVACESHNRLAPAGILADLGENGLLIRWDTFGGPAWCNPPYSNVRPWLEQALRARHRVPVVMLITADTSTRWWLECVAHEASEVRFLTGRTTPSAIVVYRSAGGPPVYSYIPAVLR